jgi:nucleotide-binding universal stress UspA family protein
MRRIKSDNGQEGRLYKHIMVPVDLGHVEGLGTALKTAADLAGHFGARVTYVGVTSTQPSSIAHTPQEFAEKLAKFAATQGEVNGVAEVASHAITANDPSVDLDHKLEDAVHELGADLVVMGSHIPKAFDFGSHGGRVATHTDVSVMLVRG